MALPRPQPDPVGPGEESVWDYPRPPRLELEPRRLRLTFHGEVIAETTRGYRVLETSHPPVYYFPPEDVRVLDHLIPNRNGSTCEFKGRNEGFDLRIPGRPPVMRACWTYTRTTPAFDPIQGYYAFYAGKCGEAEVGDEVAVPQSGDFYGGWITSWVKGPFKGVPGSWGW